MNLLYKTINFLHNRITITITFDDESTILPLFFLQNHSLLPLTSVGGLVMEAGSCQDRDAEVSSEKVGVALSKSRNN